MNMHSEIEVSVVLPCLNEAETLATCIAKAQSSLAELGIKGEVVVADNGSTDSSQEIARSLNARLIQVPLKGYGSALWAGFKEAKGKYIIMGDADDSYSLDNLEPFVNELRRGTDLVMGNRFAGTIHKGAMPWLHKYVGNPALSFIGRVLFKSDIKDFHCGMRGLNKESILALELHTSGMEFASELVVKSIFANYSISQVPTDLKKRWKV
jgi:glycosyltransferase involved in cell wall biosynthesis